VRELAADTAGSLRVGFTSTVDGPALSRLTEAFQARHPRCRMSMHEVPVCDPYAPLRRNEVDVVANWLAVRDTDLVAGPAIAYYDRVLAVSSRHRLAGRPPADRPSGRGMRGEATNRSPSGVSRTLRLVRSNSRPPKDRSKLADHLHVVSISKLRLWFLELFC
jgi:DNA-binding transcriptional LysR family regulator